MRLLFALLLLLSLCPGVAAGQEDPAHHRATARQLFHDGRELAEADRWDEAAEVFERAYRLRESGAIALNWGLALVQTGHLVAATEAFHRVVRHGDATAQQRSQAEVQLERLAPRLARVTARARAPDGSDPSDGDDDVEIRLDDRTLAPELVGIQMPVDPGAHTLVATRGEREGPPSRFEVTEGQTLVVDVVLPELPVVPTPEEVAESSTVDLGGNEHDFDASPEEPRIAGWAWALIVGGAVVVLAAIITAVALATTARPQPVCEPVLTCIEVPN